MEKLLIKNGTIIDVESGVSFIGSIEVEGNRIKRIIKQNDELPVAIETVDANGKYIIPGLIDMHCHINERYAPHFVASGVTTVRNAAGNVNLLSNLIEMPDHAPTPRVYASDRMIDGTPGQWGPTSYGNFVTVIQKKQGKKFVDKLTLEQSLLNCMDGSKERLWQQL